MNKMYDGFVILLSLIVCVFGHSYLDGNYKSNGKIPLEMSFCFDSSSQTFSGIINNTVVLQGMSSPADSYYENGVSYERMALTGVWYRGGMGSCSTGWFSLEYHTLENKRLMNDSVYGDLYCDGSDEDSLYHINASRTKDDKPDQLNCAWSDVEPHTPRGEVADKSLSGQWDDITFNISKTSAKNLYYSYSGFNADPTYGVEFPVYGEGKCYTGGIICQGYWYMKYSEEKCWRAGNEIWYMLSYDLSGRLWWASMDSGDMNYSKIHSSNFQGYQQFPRSDDLVTYNSFDNLDVRELCRDKAIRKDVWPPLS